MPAQAQEKPWLGFVSSISAALAARPAVWAGLGFYLYIPGELEHAVASALVLESTCAEYFSSESHGLENVAWDASVASYLLQRVQNG